MTEIHVLSGNRSLDRRDRAGTNLRLGSSLYVLYNLLSGTFLLVCVCGDFLHHSHALRSTSRRIKEWNLRLVFYEFWRQTKMCRTGNFSLPCCLMALNTLANDTAIKWLSYFLFPKTFQTFNDNFLCAVELLPMITTDTVSHIICAKNGNTAC